MAIPFGECPGRSDVSQNIKYIEKKLILYKRKLKNLSRIFDMLMEEVPGINDVLEIYEI